MLKLCASILLGFILCTQVQAQDLKKAKILVQYDSLQKAFPKEKLYVHLDKSVYASSDTLWFKAYLIDPALNSYSTLSGLIYVDMVTPNGTTVQTLSLPTKLGISWGSLVLNPKVYKSGTYTLRGYTNWMQNFGETYFFKKQIKIVNIPTSVQEPSTSSVAVALKKTTTTNNFPKQDPSIQFLPEGGSWITGKLQKIAFKAIAPNGKGIAIEGEVKDSRLRQIATFKSNTKGMGYFSAMAEPEEIYTAFIKIGKNKYTQQLPRAKNTGTTLIVRNDYTLDSLVISILSDVPNQALTMIGQSKGLVCFLANFPPDTKRRTIKISKRVFPTGVSQIILQSRDQILNERNFFIHHQDQLQVNLSSPSTTYSRRDSIPVKINVNDANSQPVGGSFSIAITDDNQVKKNEESDDNILSYFLLSSDLKGEIEDPAYYFKDFNEQKHDDLEALCLTQGWVNYDWDLPKIPKYRIEKEYTISGKISNLTNKPVPNAKVSIFGRNKSMMFGETTTNEKGEFVFKDLPTMDSAIFVLKVLNSKGKLGSLGFEVNEFRQLPIKTTLVPKIISDDPLDSIELNFIAVKQQEYKANPANGTRLREVTIVGKKVVKGSKNLNGPGEADQVITAEELEKAGKKTLLQLMFEKVKGFNEGFRRGSNMKDYFLSRNRVKLIIDGIDVDLSYIPNDEPPKRMLGAGITSIDESHLRHLKQYLDYYTAEDVEGIEVMRFTGNAMAYKSDFDPSSLTTFEDISYIEITTKSGAGPFLKKASNVYLVKPMNYGDNKVFYSPKYTVANKNSKKPDLRSTIYWAPNIVTNTKGEANFSFFSADKKGIYTIWIEGSDMQGKFGFKTMKLEIR
ncbi:hypothetical protein WG904_13860 [Pedobacter sp. Du54]|uniref:carboxypeptidase-like regulatory domain-containing protein n=1 Tax=Pedobacter anseongensis TaxID=3133439 RepID=UPI0030B2FFD5